MKRLHFILAVSAIIAAMIAWSVHNSLPIFYFETNSLDNIFWVWNFYILGIITGVVLMMAWERRFMEKKL